MGKNFVPSLVYDQLIQEKKRIDILYLVLMPFTGVFFVLFGYAHEFFVYFVDLLNNIRAYSAMVISWNCKLACLRISELCADCCTLFCGLINSDVYSAIFIFVKKFANFSVAIS